MVSDPTSEQKNANFFNSFFANEFRNYAQQVAESRQVVTMGKGKNKEYEITATVTVSKDQLRKYLVEKKIIKGLGGGF